MITAYETYKVSHESLFTASGAGQIADLSRKTVENYLENRRIWDELNHYKVKGTILGKHRIFNRMKRSSEIAGMKISGLVNLKNRLENNLVRNRANVRRSPDHPDTGKRMERIGEMQQELNQVNRLLNL